MAKCFKALRVLKAGQFRRRAGEPLEKVAGFSIWSGADQNFPKFLKFGVRFAEFHRYRKVVLHSPEELNQMPSFAQDASVKVSLQHLMERSLLKCQAIYLQRKFGNLLGELSVL